MPLTRPRPDRASVLMLMPAGVLVVLLLGAIAFDMSLLFLRQRQASSVATDVANDVVAVALDEEYFRATGEYRLDPRRAEAAGRALIEASDVAELVRDVEITVLGDAAVEVRITAEAEYVFARAIPGAADRATVVGRAVAEAADR